MSATKEVSLNIDELKDFLRHIVNNNRFLQSNKKPPVAVEIVGESGIGKTSSTLQLREEFGFNVVKLNLAQIEEIGDLVGFPIRQFQMCKEVVTLDAPKAEEKPKGRKVMKVVGGVLQETWVDDISDTSGVKMAATVDAEGCIWVDEHAVQEYSRQNFAFTGEKRMSYCPPEWIADKVGGGFLILDDWNRADIRFIQACMELVDRQEYISWKLPKDWHIILTANPDDGSYLVNSIDPAQRTRFIRTNLKFDVNVWGRWAEKEKIDTRCINFLLMHPELVKREVNPRSITTFFNAISSIREFEKNLPLIEMIGEGSVGVEFASLFTMFINNKLDKLPTPADIMQEPDDEKSLKRLRHVINAGGTYRADIASVLVTRIVNYNLVGAETGSVDDKIINRLIALVTDADTFTNDLTYFMTKQLLSGNHKFKKMMMNQKVMDMATK